MVHDLYEAWMAIAELPDAHGALHTDSCTHQLLTTASLDRVTTARAQFATLPPTNKHALHRIIRFCVALLAHQNVNKMSSQNIEIVLAPSLMYVLILCEI
jgi:hypothetical protein